MAILDRPLLVARFVSHSNGPRLGEIGCAFGARAAAQAYNKRRTSPQTVRRTSFREARLMPGDDSFPELMDRLRSGEDQAAREVFERFATRLVGLARRHLDGRLAVKVDPEDVVQSAYKSFFVRQREGTLAVGNWDGLWGILTMITIRKCADRAAYFLAGNRDVARDMSGRPDDSYDPMAEIAARSRTVARGSGRTYRSGRGAFRGRDRSRRARHSGTEPPGLLGARDQRGARARRTIRAATARTHPQAPRTHARRLIRLYRNRVR